MDWILYGSNAWEVGVFYYCFIYCSNTALFAVPAQLCVVWNATKHSIYRHATTWHFMKQNTLFIQLLDTWCHVVLISSWNLEVNHSICGYQHCISIWNDVYHQGDITRETSSWIPESTVTDFSFQGETVVRQKSFLVIFAYLF